MTIIVSGFGPFPGQPRNPTTDLVHALACESDVEGLVLPVSYDRAVAELDRVLRDHPEAALVAFGVAGGSTGIRVEQQSRRRTGADVPDVDGVCDVVPPGPEGAPARIPTRLPVEDLEDGLHGAGIPVEPSDDAGTYVCNHVMHHLLTSTDPYRVVGFVHVPDPALGGITTAQIERAGRVVVDVLRAHHRNTIDAPGLEEVAATWWDVDVTPVVRWDAEGRRFTLDDPNDPANRLLLLHTSKPTQDPHVVAAALAEGLAACDFPPTASGAAPGRVAATLAAARIALAD